MLWLVIIIPLLASILCLIKEKRIKKNLHLILSASMLLSLLILVLHYPSKPIIETIEWAPDFGLNLAFLVDWLSYPFLAMILLVSGISIYYSKAYLQEQKNKQLYYFLTGLFTVSMIGVVLSVNLITFYLFWDVMLVASYFLVVEWGEEKAREIGLKYFIYMAVASTSLLLGIGLFHASTDSFNLLEAKTAPAIVFLPLMISFLIKQGVFPFHDWLPDTHSVAPTPISAMLSGLMVNVGGYALLRVSSLFPEVMKTYSTTLIIIALISLYLGALMVFRQTHLKKAIAWSTVSQGGMIVFGAGALTLYALKGAGFHLVTQALTKSLLFLVAGVIIYATGTKKIDEIKGLYRKNPILTIAFFASILSLAGTPFFAAFQSEVLIFLGGLNYLAADLLLIFGSLLTLGYCLWFAHSMFFASGKTKFKKIRNEMLTTLIILTGLIIIVGVYPNILMVW